MNVIDFLSWAERRRQQQRQHLPAADKLVPLVAQAGANGMSRGQIGGAIEDLDREALDELLAGLVDFGLLTMNQGVYRARPIAPAFRGFHPFR